MEAAHPCSTTYEKDRSRKSLRKKLAHLMALTFFKASVPVTRIDGCTGRLAACRPKTRTILNSNAFKQEMNVLKSALHQQKRTPTASVQMKNVVPAHDHNWRFEADTRIVKEKTCAIGVIKIDFKIHRIFNFLFPRPLTGGGPGKMDLPTFLRGPTYLNPPGVLSAEL